MKRISELQNTVQTEAFVSSVPNSNYVFNIRGNTDTEHLATLYFAHLDVIRAGILSAIRRARDISTFNFPHGFQTGQQPPPLHGGSGITIPFNFDSTDSLLLALINTITDIHAIQRQYQVGPFTPGPFPPGKNFAGNKLNLCISLFSLSFSIGTVYLMTSPLQLTAEIRCSFVAGGTQRTVFLRVFIFRSPLARSSIGNILRFCLILRIQRRLSTRLSKLTLSGNW